MSRYLHGWRIFVELLSMQLRKKHGGGRAPFKRAVFFARCGRWIAVQQHKPHLNPYCWLGEEGW